MVTHLVDRESTLVYWSTSQLSSVVRTEDLLILFLTLGAMVTPQVDQESTLGQPLLRREACSECQKDAGSTLSLRKDCLPHAS